MIPNLGSLRTLELSDVVNTQTIEQDIDNPAEDRSMDDIHGANVHEAGEQSYSRCTNAHQSGTMTVGSVPFPDREATQAVRLNYILDPGIAQHESQAVV